MASSRPITEDDLDGFVDHLLDSAPRSEVQTYLHDHPEIAARIAAVSRPREALSAAAAPIADEPIPPHLNLRNLMEGRTLSGPRLRTSCDRDSVSEERTPTKHFSPMSRDCDTVAAHPLEFVS